MLQITFVNHIKKISVTWPIRKILGIPLKRFISLRIEFTKEIVTLLALRKSAYTYLSYFSVH